MGCLLPLEGPSSPSSVAWGASSSLDLGWALAQDQQEAEENEEVEDLRGVWTYFYPEERAPCSYSS